MYYLVRFGESLGSRLESSMIHFALLFFVRFLNICSVVILVIIVQQNDIIPMDGTSRSAIAVLVTLLRLVSQVADVRMIITGS